MKNFCLTIFFVIIFISSIYSQQASDYFPIDPGHTWKFKMTLLDSINQPVPSAVTFKVDSFAFASEYFGRETKYVVSKSGSEELLPVLPYIDSIFLNMSGSEGYEYYRNGGFSGVLSWLDSLGLDSNFSFINLFQSFQGWYSKYRLDANVNSNYTIFSYDTSITYDSTTLPLRFSFRGKQADDENIQTQIGDFNCKKFVMSNVISYLVTIPPGIILAFPILTFNDSIWLAPSNWIVKEFAPSTRIDLSILGFPSFIIPGYTSEIMSIPTSVEDENPVAMNFSLDQNYPNPFNPATKIKYTVTSNGKGQMSKVILKVFNILGNEITTLVNKEQSAGTYEVEFSAKNLSGSSGAGGLSSGIYFYRLEVGSSTETRKMVLLK